jgi:hypothetical protein
MIKEPNKRLHADCLGRTSVVTCQSNLAQAAGEPGRYDIRMLSGQNALTPQNPDLGTTVIIYRYHKKLI